MSKFLTVGMVAVAMLFGVNKEVYAKEVLILTINIEYKTGGQFKPCPGAKVIVWVGDTVLNCGAAYTADAQGNVVIQWVCLSQVTPIVIQAGWVGGNPVQTYGCNNDKVGTYQKLFEMYGNPPGVYVAVTPMPVGCGVNGIEIPKEDSKEKVKEDKRESFFFRNRRHCRSGSCA